MSTPNNNPDNNIYTDNDRRFMLAALAQARLAIKHGEVPIGCVIVHNGTIVGRGYNRRNTDKCTLSHAEITAIRRASKKLSDWRLEDCTMYVTLEPCQMCAGAIVQARIPRVIAGASSPKAGCAGSVLNILENNEFNHQVDYSVGLLEEECSSMLKRFFRDLRFKSREQKLQKDHSIRNLIFDIDGTLWNTTEIVATAWNEAIEDVGLADSLGLFVTADMLSQEFGKPMDIIIDDLFPNQSHDKKVEILERVKIREKAAIKRCTSDLAYPDVVSTIESLYNQIQDTSDHKYNLYIVSNCQDGYIELVMQQLGITKYISDYESFGRTGLSKAENIKLLMKRNKLASGETYYVGDTLGDYESTKQSCISFIFASYGFGEMEENYSGLSISEFSELLHLTTTD